MIIHIVNQLPENPAAEFTARVDPEKRQAAANNHTATHLLDAALKQVLGEHVSQAGSLVTPEHLRFDFTHFEALSSEQLKAVEDLVNQQIFASKPVVTRVMGIDEAKAAGADYVGGMELVEKITKENWFDFDVVVASPDMMGVVGRLGKVLGPKGLMPSPKAGTVTPDVAKAVKEVKAGKVEYRLDKTNIIHCPIGKVSFGPEKLTENFNAIMGAIVKAKPAAAKGQYIKSCVAASTMGPGVKMSTAKL
mgnify:CR=1 FL=1